MQQFNERLELAAIMNAAAMYNKLPPSRVLPKDRAIAIEKLIKQAREDNAKRPFTDAQLRKIEEDCAKEIAECEIAGRNRYKTRMREQKRL